MAGVAIDRTAPPNLTASIPAPRQGIRPLPLRKYSEAEADEFKPKWTTNKDHTRHKSEHIASGFMWSTLDRLGNERAAMVHSNERGVQKSCVSSGSNHIEVKYRFATPARTTSSYFTPPVTPMTDAKAESKEDGRVEILKYDFSRIDYELDRAKLIGRGLWSNVYFAEPTVRSPTIDTLTTPPPTPQRRSNIPPCSVYAVKVAARPDATKIFHQEARMLTILQRSDEAHDHIVPFYGLDGRNSGLIFEGVDGGSLESLVARLKTMTELERHLELRGLFGKLSNDLIGGLHFIHSAGVVHADIKPANVLLDLVNAESSRNLVVRARYIDFSASFLAGAEYSANAGGTWDFMAPEQLSRDKELSTPTFRSDIWSLGVTLLYLLVGASPYYAVGDSIIRVREAIKVGTPLVYARSDPIVQKRMATCQDFVDCCRRALQKDRDSRWSTAAWKAEVQKTLLPAQR